MRCNVLLVKESNTETKQALNKFIYLLNTISKLKPRQSITMACHIPFYIMDSLTLHLKQRHIIHYACINHIHMQKREVIYMYFTRLFEKLIPVRVVQSGLHTAEPLLSIF